MRFLLVLTLLIVAAFLATDAAAAPNRFKRDTKEVAAEVPNRNEEIEIAPMGGSDDLPDVVDPPKPVALKGNGTQRRIRRGRQNVGRRGANRRQASATAAAGRNRVNGRRAAAGNGQRVAARNGRRVAATNGRRAAARNGRRAAGGRNLRNGRRAAGRRSRAGNARRANGFRRRANNE